MYGLEIFTILGTNITTNDSDVFIIAPKDIGSDYKGVDYVNAAVSIALANYGFSFPSLLHIAIFPCHSNVKKPCAIELLKLEQTAA